MFFFYFCIIKEHNVCMVKDYLYYLFDFDLTLADSSRGIVMCFTHVLQRHGYQDVTEMQIKRTIGKTLEESFSILTGVSNPEQLAAWKLEYTKEADIYMNDNTVLFPETVSVLTKLKEQGAKLAIISTKYRYRIQGVMDRYFPKDFIDVIIGGEDVKVAKPDPRGVKVALKKLKAKKKLALYVGDSTVDAETAQNAGIDFCGVLNGLTTFDELAVYPHRQILNDLTLLPLLQKDTVIGVSRFNTNPAKWNVKRRAFNIKQIRGRQSKPLENPERHVCQNCGDVYEGDFCSSCGQPAKTERITLRNSFTNFLSSFFSIDSGFLHTIHELWYRPGYMVTDFVQGKRKPYYKPFSLLIVMAALYIVAAHLFDPKSVGNDSNGLSRIGYQIDSLVTKSNSVPTDSLQLSSNDWQEAQEDHNENEYTDDNGAKITAWINEHTGPGTYFYAIKDLLGGWFDNNQAFLFILTIPFYLIGVRRAFRHTRVNKRLNMGEYVFAFGYFGSQLMMKDIAMIPFTGSELAPKLFASASTTINMLIEFLLMIRNFKQLYRIDWWTALKGTVKTFIIMLSSIIILIVLIITLIVLITAMFTA